MQSSNLITIVLAVLAALSCIARAVDSTDQKVEHQVDPVRGPPGSSRFSILGRSATLVREPPANETPKVDAAKKFSS